jgi:hypothetical protein
MVVICEEGGHVVSCLCSLYNTSEYALYTKTQESGRRCRILLGQSWHEYFQQKIQVQQHILGTLVFEIDRCKSKGGSINLSKEEETRMHVAMYRVCSS